MKAKIKALNEDLNFGVKHIASHLFLSQGQHPSVLETSQSSAQRADCMMEKLIQEEELSKKQIKLLSKSKRVTAKQALSKKKKAIEKCGASSRFGEK